MRLSVKIYLPFNRWNTGLLAVHDAEHRELFAAPCRGKADGQNAARHDNPNRDSTKPWGDTPTGAYEPTQLVEFAERIQLGDAWVPLEGAEGDALKAKQQGRTGLGIHAGRGEKLMATYGCVRLRQKAFDRFAEIVEGHELLPTVVDALS